MPTTDPGALVVGDDWRIVGKLLDRDGNPLDLTDASIAWTLLDPSGALVEVNPTIIVADPPIAGIVNIKLTAGTWPLYRSAADLRAGAGHQRSKAYRSWS